MTSEALWTEHQHNPKTETREALIHQYIPLAKHVVDRLHIRDSSALSRDDLISQAIVGLIDALERFDPSRQVKFETYASVRIRGAVMDMLRKLDWAPRSVRRMEREVRETYVRLEETYGRPATDSEVADALRMTQEELQETLQDIGQTAVFSLDDCLQTDQRGEARLTLADVVSADDDPLHAAEESEQRHMLAHAIGKLPERERMVVAMYYYEELTLKEIGKVFGVTEARISQILSKAVSRLNGRLLRFEPVFCS